MERIKKYRTLLLEWNITDKDKKNLNSNVSKQHIKTLKWHKTKSNLAVPN